MPSREDPCACSPFGVSQLGSHRVILVAAATEPELTGANGVRTLACGIGPVESAATTARGLANLQPAAVLHVGIAGARTLPAPSLVIGSESVYQDAGRGGLVRERVAP